MLDKRLILVTSVTRGTSNCIDGLLLIFLEDGSCVCEFRMYMMCILLLFFQVVIRILEFAERLNLGHYSLIFQHLLPEVWDDSSCAMKFLFVRKHFCFILVSTWLCGRASLSYIALVQSEVSNRLPCWNGLLFSLFLFVVCQGSLLMKLPTEN